jgi:hypothetical protein
MRFCQPHWDALRQGVENRGMMHLVAKSGEEAAANLKAELENEGEVFDPLMGSFWRITTRFVRNAERARPGSGIAYMSDPECCPLCMVQGSYDLYDQMSEPRPPEATDAQGWIDGTLDQALEHAREEGLMPRVS